MGYLVAIITQLGMRQGVAYDFRNKELVSQTGATIATMYNMALDLSMINTDGVSLTLDYNIGAVLPVINAPILNFTQYLYIGGGYAERYHDDEWQGTPIVDAQFKFKF
jgi:hypothetical protein